MDRKFVAYRYMACKGKTCKASTLRGSRCKRRPGDCGYCGQHGGGRELLDMNLDTMLSIMEQLSSSDIKSMCKTNANFRDFCKTPEVKRILQRKQAEEIPASLEEVIAKHRGPSVKYLFHNEDLGTLDGVLDKLSKKVPVTLTLVDHRTGEVSREVITTLNKFYELTDAFFSQHPEYKGTPSVFAASGSIDIDAEKLDYAGEFLEYAEPPITSSSNVKGADINKHKSWPGGRYTEIPHQK